MADDENITFPDDDDPIIVDDYDEIIEEDGQATIIRRAFSETSGVNEHTRSYTEINGGIITFGYRNIDSGNRNPAYTIQPDRLLSGGNTYLGLNCNAAKIKIAQETVDHDDTSMLTLQVNGSYPPSGYLQCITSMTKSQASGVDWTVEVLPFRYGMCIAVR